MSYVSSIVSKSTIRTSAHIFTSVSSSWPYNVQAIGTIDSTDEMVSVPYIKENGEKPVAVLVELL